MKRRNYIAAGVLLPLLALMLPSCKPTEKNYKQAYDIAITKKTKQADDDALLLGPKGQLEGAPQTQMVDGDSLPVLAEQLKLVWPEEYILRPCNVAVAKYRMKTNALSQAQRLVGDGLQSAVVKNAQDHYYVLAGSFTSTTEASQFIKGFEARHKDMPYVGLDTNRPLVLLIPVN